MRTDTALPGMMTEGTATVATAVIVTGTGIVTRDATGTEDTTGTVIDETTTGGLEDTRGVDTDENARRGLVHDVKTTCKSTALQKLTVETAIEEGTRSAEGMAWELRRGEALPRRMRFSSR